MKARDSELSDVGRVEEILQVQGQEGDGHKQEIFIVVRKFYTGGQHAQLKMPTIHATEEEIYVLAHIEVCTTQITIEHMYLLWSP